MTLHVSVELGPRNVGEKTKRNIKGLKGPVFAVMSRCGSCIETESDIAKIQRSQYVFNPD